MKFTKKRIVATIALLALMVLTACNNEKEIKESSAEEPVQQEHGHN